jgi:hypothetical protein
MPHLASLGGSECVTPTGERATMARVQFGAERGRSSREAGPERAIAGDKATGGSGSGRSGVGP